MDSSDIRNLTGVIPPMITPFAADDSIDPVLLREETQFLLKAGVDGVVVGGSTGEGAGMSAEELSEAVSIVVETVQGAIPVLSGIIADRSEEAVRLGVAARKAGAVGLQVPPPNLEFSTSSSILARYYRAITDGTGLPIIIYNVIPWAQLSADALSDIVTENSMITGIKQSGGNIDGLATLLAYLKNKVKLYSAIDDLLYPSLLLGADGTISGTSSLFPIETVELWNSVKNGTHARALELHRMLIRAWRQMDGPEFPSRIKYALALMGRPAGKARGPFPTPAPEAAAGIEEALQQSGLLSRSANVGYSEL
jgi:4-hydroxy-tetrahydrodipicolinate synthase